MLFWINERSIHNLEPQWPLFLKVNPSKQALLQSKTRVIGVLGICVYIYIYITYHIYVAIDVLPSKPNPAQSWRFFQSYCPAVFDGPQTARSGDPVTSQDMCRIREEHNIGSRRSLQNRIHERGYTPIGILFSRGWFSGGKWVSGRYHIIHFISIVQVQLHVYIQHLLVSCDRYVFSANNTLVFPSRFKGMKLRSSYVVLLRRWRRLHPPPRPEV